MPSITVRNLDSDLKDRLRAQAARHGCSMAQEARNILEAALPEPPPPAANESDPSESLWESIRKRFEPLGGMELDLPTRRSRVRPPPVEPDPADPPQGGLGTAIHNLFKPLGGVDLELPPREVLRLDQCPHYGCPGH